MCRCDLAQGNKGQNVNGLAKSHVDFSVSPQAAIVALLIAAMFATITLASPAAHAQTYDILHTFRARPLFVQL
jgi:hypothetical protein